MMYCYLKEGRQHGGRRYVYALLCKIKSIFRGKRMKFHCCKRAACILILRGSRVLQKMHGRRSWDVDGSSSHSHVARVHEPKLRFEYRNISLIIPLRIVFFFNCFFFKDQFECKHKAWLSPRGSVIKTNFSMQQKKQQSSHSPFPHVPVVQTLETGLSTEEFTIQQIRV